MAAACTLRIRGLLLYAGLAVLVAANVAPGAESATGQTSLPESHCDGAACASREDTSDAPSLLQYRCGEEGPLTSCRRRRTGPPSPQPVPLPSPPPGGGWTWTGANSYYLWALAPEDIDAVLSTMQNASVKVLRIFVVTVLSPKDGTSATTYYDIEHDEVGNFNTSSPDRFAILRKIDSLMYKAYKKGIKLDIALHDRYSLGVWKTDAYVSKYNLTATTSPDAQNVTNFYNNTAAQHDFDNRLQFLLQHENPYFGNKTWGMLGEAVFTVGIQNEAQGHVLSPDMGLNYEWWCGRARLMKQFVGGGVRISTGGSYNLAQGVSNSASFACPDIDIISMHSYDSPGTNYELLIGQLNAAVGLAQAASAPKRIIFEEFGQWGSDQNKRGLDLGQWMGAVNSVGVPFMPWQLMDPGNQCPGAWSCFNFWTGDESWTQLAAWTASAGQTPGRFTWPELLNSTKAPGQLCGGNGECQSDCCSQVEGAAHSVCVAAASHRRCTGAKLRIQDYCTLNSQCDSGCCSNGSPSGSKSLARFSCVPAGSAPCTGF